MNISFLNLTHQVSIEQSIKDVILKVIDEDLFIGGQSTKNFSNKFKTYLHSKNFIPTANGTDSLFISLKTLGIKSGDEVITSAMSWISSSETISLCGATPVFVDVDKTTYTLDPKLIEEKITPKTKAIIVVHLYGQAAHVSEIKRICDKHNLFMIEDCAQAHLTAEGEQYVGTFGHAGAFSFYPTKNLGAYGDAGGITTNDDMLAEKMRRFANHGALIKDDHLMEGMNSRMDSIQAAVLLAKLPYLKQWNQQRIANAAFYNHLLADLSEIVLPFVRPNTTHTFHLYVIRTKERDRLKSYLEEKGIQTLIHYPKALPNLPAYQHMHHIPSDFPVASALQDEVLSLPIYPELKEEEIKYVAQAIRDFYSRS